MADETNLPKPSAGSPGSVGVPAGGPVSSSMVPSPRQPLGLEDLLKDLPPKVSAPQSSIFQSSISALQAKGQIVPTAPLSPRPNPLIGPGSQSNLSSQSTSSRPLGQIGFTVPEPLKVELRTMKDDLSAISKGKTPTVSPIELKPEKPELRPPPVFPGLEKASLQPLKPPVQVSIGASEKAKLIPIPAPSAQVKVQPPIIKPQIPSSAAPGISVPTRKVGLNKNILFIIVGIIVIGGAVFLFLKGSNKTQSPTPSITVSITPTITPRPRLNDLILNTKNLDFTSQTLSPINVLAELTKSVSAVFGEVNLVNLFEKPATSNDGPDLSAPVRKISLEEFLSLMNITHPSDLLSNLMTEDWGLIVYTQRESFDKGIQKEATKPIAKLGLIIQVENEVGLRSTLNVWESTLTSDIKSFIPTKIGKPATIQFLENTYKGIVIRYINFPYPDFSIDYAIVKAKNGQNYLIFIESRESTYGLIDLLTDFNGLGI